jgi:hypothetical protein
VRQAPRELDAIHVNPWSRLLRDDIPELPSTDLAPALLPRRGFFAYFGLERYEDIGVETITWGRDYPHIEGTWPFTSESRFGAY